MNHTGKSDEELSVVTYKRAESTINSFFFFHTTRFTVISAMSSLGNLYAETVKNMVTASVFEIFIKNLFKWYHKEIKPERGVI